MDLEYLKRHVSGVLTVTASVGVIATAYFASEESEGAKEAVKEKKPANVHEHLLAVLPKRKKTIISTAVTVGCIVGSHTIDMQTIAKLAGSYAAIGGAFSRFKGEAKRYLGDRYEELESKFEEEEDELHSDAEVVHWFYEPITGQFFEASWREYWEAIDDAHKIVTLTNSLRFNDFLQFFGLKSKLSNAIGWDTGDLECEYGYPWVDIDYEERNNPEKGEVDFNFNDGRITYELIYRIAPGKIGAITDFRKKQSLL